MGGAEPEHRSGEHRTTGGGAESEHRSGEHRTTGGGAESEHGSGEHRTQTSPVPFVGLTGGMASGKSTALAALGELGAATLSADAVVHELLGTDEVRDAVGERLGSEVIVDGELDRAAMGARVFASEADREWLEGLLWPRVRTRVAAWREALVDADDPHPALVVEVPLLFESGQEASYDHTIAVVADESVRAERAGGRGHEGLEGRTGRQLSQEEKSQRADFTVRNDGTREELKAELSKFLATIQHGE